ncbi:hypothetical protein AV530_010580 [Patagioenas fasciata monilis]|uniref:Uncharacterized protein n=1 Tax=Patagioenas fasciata monilis TaxID=372326 RepID=A0A1V4KFE8_PATFA|nr:hypothetical protein AV530_010580 [Patagioenas fasciata monilis]
MYTRDALNLSIAVPPLPWVRLAGVSSYTERAQQSVIGHPGTFWLLREAGGHLSAQELHYTPGSRNPPTPP